MTKFQLDQFDFGRGSERWVMYGPERKFVGRFKYRGASAAKHFVKFLITNFEVEEYFELLNTPNPKKSVEEQLRACRSSTSERLPESESAEGYEISWC